jgi:hypothetical protein
VGRARDHRFEQRADIENGDGGVTDVRRHQRGYVFLKGASWYLRYYLVVEPRLGGPPPILGLLTELQMLGKTDDELVPQADADTLACNPLAPIRYALPFRGQLERRRLDVAPSHSEQSWGSVLPRAQVIAVRALGCDERRTLSHGTRN